MIDLTGRHVFVAGGSRGIGAGAARLAAKLGARVSLTYIANAAAADAVMTDAESPRP